MTTLKNYRGIAVKDDDGRTVTMMMFHSSIDDKIIKQLMYVYRFKVMQRIMEKKAENLVAEDTRLHYVHRVNLLKKEVRLNSELNGVIKEKVYIVNGPVFDCKDWKKMDRNVLARAYTKMLKNSDCDVRIIETKDEIEWYSQFGEVIEVGVIREKVFFVDVKGIGVEEGIKELNLYSDMEDCFE